MTWVQIRNFFSFSLAFQQLFKPFTTDDTTYQSNIVFFLLGQRLIE